MSERYTKLFTLPERLYAEGAPVMIMAGALLKDNQTGGVLAQLRLRNLNGKRLRAVTVAIQSIDTAGRPLGEPMVFRYLDLSVQNGEDFGAQTPIRLADAATRAFSATVEEVVFEDQSVWTADGAPWETVALPQPLSQSLSDGELIMQFQITYGADCKNVYTEEKDLWYCVCGKLNKKDDAVCRACGREAKTLADFALAKLKSAKDARLAQEKKEAEECARKAEAERQEAQRRAAIAAKKAKKIIAITAPILVACVAIAIMLTKVIIPTAKHNKALGMIESGDYEAAYALLEELGDTETITQNKYDRALKLIDSGDYIAANALLLESGHEESAKKIEEIMPQYHKALLLNAEIGDPLFFGTYEQDNDPSNGKEEIEWVVLAKEDDRVLVISQYALDCQKYNSTNTAVTWETCSLRGWLNDAFLNDAFSTEEQSQIESVTVTADQNPKNSTPAGNDTTDKVFLLSIREVNKYFSSASASQCQGTAYCYAQGAYKASNGNCWWWLRSPGISSNLAADVNDDGYVDFYGNFGYIDNYAVRPALWINLPN